MQGVLSLAVSPILSRVGDLFFMLGTTEKPGRCWTAPVWEKAALPKPGQALVGFL